MVPAEVPTPMLPSPRVAKLTPKRSGRCSLRLSAKFHKKNFPIEVEVQNPVQSASRSILHLFKHFHKPNENPVAVTPLTVQRNGERLRYVWKGNRLKAVAASVCDGHTNEREGVPHVMILRRVYFAILYWFFPDPLMVTPDYWEWMQWRLFSRFFGTCIAVFGTQSLLMAVGMGARKSLMASSAINWMIKDGWGRISRLVIATKFSKQFDANVKKARLLSLVLCTLFYSGDFLTPFIPSLFLPLSLIANLGATIVTTAFVATSPSIAITFAERHNLCDITAKTQAQYGVVDSTAIAVAALLTHYCRRSPFALSMLPVVIYVISSVLTIFGAYKESKALVFKALNVHRMNIVAQHWIQHGHSLTPPQVCRLESAFGEWLQDDKSEAEVKIGRLEDMVDCPMELDLILDRHRGDRFLLSLNRAMKRRNAEARTALLISFQEGVQNDDVILAFLTGAYAREKLRSEQPSSRREMSLLLERAKDDAKHSFSTFVQALEKAGWKMADLPIQVRDIQFMRSQQQQHL